jgi:hypothetical protein
LSGNGVPVRPPSPLAPSWLALRRHRPPMRSAVRWDSPAIASRHADLQVFPDFGGRRVRAGSAPTAALTLFIRLGHAPFPAVNDDLSPISRRHPVPDAGPVGEPLLPAGKYIVARSFRPACDPDRTPGSAGDHPGRIAGNMHWSNPDMRSRLSALTRRGASGAPAREHDTYRAGARRECTPVR